MGEWRDRFVSERLLIRRGRLTAEALMDAIYDMEDLRLRPIGLEVRAEAYGELGKEIRREYPALKWHEHLFMGLLVRRMPDLPMSEWRLVARTEELEGALG